MSTHAARVTEAVVVGSDGPARRTLAAWFLGFAVMVFAIPVVCTDWLEMDHDLYLLIYGSLVVLYLALFLSRTRTDWRAIAKRNLWWSLGLGVAVGVAAVQNVLSDDSTRHPTGVFFGFELAWRGVFYGIIDALALFVFPAIVAYLLMHGDRRGAARKIGFAALTLALTLVVTATYHLGYPQFRDSDLTNPETGAVLMSVPAMLTGNPAGALLAHPAIHVTAVAHEYFGHDPGYLPPQLTGYKDRWGDTTAWVLAAIWIALVAGVVWLARRRHPEHTRPAAQAQTPTG